MLLRVSTNWSVAMHGFHLFTFELIATKYELRWYCLSHVYDGPRAIFVWPWNENARIKQKQQTDGNRAIWLVYRTDANVLGFWLVKQTLGVKKRHPENFLEINRYFALTSYCKTIGQSNNAFAILGFCLAGKLRGHLLIFLYIGW